MGDSNTEDSLRPEKTTLGGPARIQDAVTAEWQEKLSRQQTRLGRYEVLRTLGTGGFGTVVLARDTQLDRLVAVKIPNARRFKDSQSVDSLLSEARMAACLRHDGIVTVFDVGWEGPVPFIVLEYIPGRTLSEFIARETWSHEFAARMALEIARALHHAHSEGFVHRDLKPQNILLDNEDRPRISDFGLAVRHRDLAASSDRLVGTPMYMAPEQATGENHRIDQRTDIWALGVIFYQLLCRQRPFSGSVVHDIIGSIARAEFAPPSQVEPMVPRELERICMRCMSRRMSQRYPDADELARDLAVWLHHTGDDSGLSSACSSDAFLPSLLHQSETALVVARGLRPFKPEDSGFFTRLLPGPRDRNGLPLTLSFWISTLGRRNSDSTVGVGLLYGPSGCGKSSFVRAGVIPFLDAGVTTLYVDSTPQELEASLKKGLIARFEFLRDIEALPEMLAELREHISSGDGGPGDRAKVVVFIDQFEQWLAQNPVEPDQPLVQALRQCDGRCVQCVLIVRDDFWLPVSRFMGLLELSIVDGENAMLIDSFDADHARNVLVELGRSISCLPAAESEMTDGQRDFINRAVAELSERGLLFPVQLTVFAELVRKEPWNAETLDQLGGAHGVGVAFLENMVGRKASAARQIHGAAARRVLSELLPIHGDIRKPSVPRERLLDVSGYAQSPRDFDSLLRLLVGELRLLTPVRATDGEDDHDSVSAKSGYHDVAAYRLTHDFLVPSLRQWLEEDLRGKRGGRQQLMLREQAAMWTDRRSTRYLPSIWEYALLRIYTRSSRWTQDQADMMRAAGKRIGRRVLAFAMVLVAIGVFAGLAYRQQIRKNEIIEAARLLDSLRAVPIDEAPAVLDRMDPLAEHTIGPAMALLADDQRRIPERMRCGLACLRQDSRPLRQILAWVTRAELRPRDVAILCGELERHRQTAIPLLQAGLRDEKMDQISRFRMAAVLARLAPEDPALDSMQDELVATLLQQPDADAEIWLSVIQPLGDRLLAPLKASYHEDLDIPSARIVVAALDRYASPTSQLVPELLAAAKGPQFRAVIERFGDRITEMKHWIRDDDPWLSGPSRCDRAIINFAVARAICGDAALFETVCRARNSPQRSQLIAALNPQRLDLWRLLELVDANSANRQASNVLVMACDAYASQSASKRQRGKLQILLGEACRTTDDAELHVAAKLILNRWGLQSDSSTASEIESNRGPATGRRWLTDSRGREYAIIDVPASDAHPSYRIAMGVAEISVGEVREFEREVGTRFLLRGADSLPAGSLRVASVTGFCNWCSKQEHVAEDQWCYDWSDESQGKAAQTPTADFMRKTGYRLPTKEEWVAAAGGDGAHWLDGCDESVTRRYIWNRRSSDFTMGAVGERLPNPQGLIDLYGNAAELCLMFSRLAAGNRDDIYCKMGGSVLGDLHSYRGDTSQETVDIRILDSYTGFRLVRTLPSVEATGAATEHTFALPCSLALRR